MSTVTSFELNVPYITEPRKIWVYLPENYEARDMFPVIYMNDGQNLFYDNLSGSRVSWRVPETMDELYFVYGYSSIVAGVESSQIRESEYMPWAERPASRRGKSEDINHGEEYTDFLAKNLKPYMDANYRTDAGAGGTAIAGAGRGALSAVFTAMKYSYIFGAAGVFSLAAKENFKKFTKFIREIELKRPLSLYIYSGKEDAQEQNRLFSEALTQTGLERGLPVRTVFDSGGFNHESRWGSEFGGFVKYFLEQRQNAGRSGN